MSIDVTPERSTYKMLTQDELEWKDCKAKQSLFMESLHQSLGPHATVNDLVKLGSNDTKQYNLCEDESQNDETFPFYEKEPEITPECKDKYMDKHDANGNPNGRSHQNPMLDIHLYEREFPGGEIKSWQLISLQS